MLKKLEIEILNGGGLVLRQTLLLSKVADHRIALGEVVEGYAQGFRDEELDDLFAAIKKAINQSREDYPK